MAETAESRLKAMGITLHTVPAPAANYVPSVRVGNLLFVSGQVSATPSASIKGKLGQNMSVEQGIEAAKLCAISVLSVIKGGIGDLENVKRIVKLTGFVNCTGDFEDAHKVINGCSNVLTDVLGDRGKHARSAVGMACLPLGFAVEVEAIVEVA